MPRTTRPAARAAGLRLSVATVGAPRPAAPAVSPTAGRTRGEPVVALALAVGLASGCAAPAARDPDHVIADARTSTRVRERLLADPLIGGSALGVEVQEGVATVTGVAPDGATAARALRVVRDTRGVREVVSRVALASPPASGSAR